jgi:nucleoside-diphosphate-sugar epimerase
MANTRVLVTGGAGYLGSILRGRLLDGLYAVTVLDNLTYGQYSPFRLCANPEFVFGDAGDEAVVRRVVRDADVLIPLAATRALACGRDPFRARVGWTERYGGVKLDTGAHSRICLKERRYGPGLD